MLDDKQKQLLAKYPGALEHQTNVEEAATGNLPKPRDGETQDAANRRLLEYMAVTGMGLPPKDTPLRTVLDQYALSCLLELQAKGLSYKAIFAAATEMAESRPIKIDDMIIRM